jgi:UPF0716 family protein affecting phage T7 exclusion
MLLAGGIALILPGGLTDTIGFLLFAAATIGHLGGVSGTAKRIKKLIRHSSFQYMR